MPPPHNNKQEEMNLSATGLAAPADHREKQKPKKISEPCSRVLKNSLNTKVTLTITFRVLKEIIIKNLKNWDCPDHSTAEISKITWKIPGELRRLAPVKTVT